MKIHKSKKRAVESEVQKGWNTFVALFALEVKIGLGSRATLDRIRRWETKAMSRLFRFKKMMRPGQTFAQEQPGLPGKYG